MPPLVHRRLAESAREHGKSLNLELVTIITKALGVTAGELVEDAGIIERDLKMPGEVRKPPTRKRRSRAA